MQSSIATEDPVCSSYNLEQPNKYFKKYTRERREVREEMQGDGSTKTHPGNKQVNLKRVVDKRSLSLARVISIQ